MITSLIQLHDIQFKIQSHFVHFFPKLSGLITIQMHVRTNISKWTHHRSKSPSPFIHPDIQCRLDSVRSEHHCFNLFYYLFIYLFVRDSAINIDNIWCVAHRVYSFTLICNSCPWKGFSEKKGEETIVQTTPKYIKTSRMTNTQNTQNKYLIPIYIWKNDLSWLTFTHCSLFWRYDVNHSIASGEKL